LTAGFGAGGEARTGGDGVDLLAGGDLTSREGMLKEPAASAQIKAAEMDLLTAVWHQDHCDPTSQTTPANQSLLLSVIRLLLFASHSEVSITP
jgi:hypothetical protein